ncbi:hypothetical protein Tco_1169384, partial [Tanacetum coccineum]
NYQRPRDHLHESDLYPGVPESIIESLTTVPVVMKSVQSMLLSMTPVKRSGNPESGLGVGAVVKLSSTLYLDVGVVKHYLLQGGNSALRMSSLRSTGGGMDSEVGSGGSSDNGNGNDIGTSGGKCSDDGGGGSGGEGI